MNSPVNQSITGRLRGLLGNPVVLLQIGHGQKIPLSKGWQATTLADCDAAHWRELDTGRHNIGVLLGAASGGLCSIDIDAEADIAAFLERNPRLKETLRTTGRRGCNLWVRVEGSYPKLSRVKAPDGRHWGEWRADGGQTVIYGRHPEGMDYRMLVERPVVSLAFADIDWGELVVPWALQAGGTAEPGQDAEAAAQYEELVRQHGEPVHFPERGQPQLNQCFFVARFAVEHRVLHEAAERQFYFYEHERGLWMRATVDRVKRLFAEDLKRFGDAIRYAHIDFQRNNALLGSLAELLRGQTEAIGVFVPKGQLVHLANGMLDLACDPPQLRAFSAEYYSRNQCPLPLQAGATCPRFLSVLLEAALDPEDIDLLQRWAGSLLLGFNAAQRIAVLTGTAGGGKSTLLEIIEAIVGLDNIHELRTEHLHERFELQFFIGKTLLTGKDVPGDFLQRRGASMLKKLVGNDFISPEKKGVNDIIRMRGTFNVAVTANSRLQVRLDGDAEAWRRRLMVIRYERPKPKERIPDFGRQLLEQEGPGILAWMLAGAVRHLRELREHGDFVLTERQRQRVDDLLAESDSVRAFVRDCVRHSTMGDVSTDELVKAYRDYCESKDWEPQSKRQVESQLPDLMLECLGVSRSHKIARGGASVRGYAGVSLNEGN